MEPVIDEINFGGPTTTLNVANAYPYTGTSTTARGGIAQAFIGTGQTIQQAQILLLNPTQGNTLNNGGVTLAILDNNFTILAQSTPNPKTSIASTSAQWQTFTFPEPCQTQPDTPYYLAVMNTPTTGSSNLNFGCLLTQTVNRPDRVGQLASQRNNTWILDTASNSGLIFRLLGALVVVPPLVSSPPDSVYAVPADVAEILSTVFDETSFPSVVDVAAALALADGLINVFCGHDWWLHSTQEAFDVLGVVPPRVGSIFLGKGPVCQVDKVEWLCGQQWVPAAEGTPSAADSRQGYRVYLERGEVCLHHLVLMGRRSFRVSYFYGYLAVPECVKRLSALLGALKVLAVWTGGAFAGSYPVGSVNAVYPKDGAYKELWTIISGEAHKIMYTLSRVNRAGGVKGRVFHQ